MSYPQGFNPVGEHAPGLPRHDAPLPGHAPSGYTPIYTQDSPAPTYGSYTGNARYAADPGFSPAFGIWSGRFIMVCAIALTLPIQIVLYPIAGAAGLATGVATYLARGSLDWSWTACFLALVPAMRLEISFENRASWYRNVRHWLRLAIVAGWIYYIDRYEQLDSPQTAALMAAIIAVLMHFILRAQLTTGLWHQLQTWLWLRKP
jgi:hypothetical protein